ncbi:MAG: hypothetical protein Q4C70_03460 [Planctomycetia bacterium]|nr:hypothetical protein [Planctomycetia bacterium]
MNYLRILKATLPVWGIISLGVYFSLSTTAFIAQSTGFVACLVGALLGEYAQGRVLASHASYSGAAFLFASLPRTIIPVIFLVFSLKSYHYPLDKITQCVIIGSYFAYYPLLLGVSTHVAIQRAKSLDHASPTSPEVSLELAIDAESVTDALKENR